MLSIALPAHNAAERKYVCRYIFEERLGVACEFRDSSEPVTVISAGARRLTIPERFFAGPDGAYLHDGSLTDPAPARLHYGVLGRAAGDRSADVIAPFGVAHATEAADVADDSITLSFDALGAVFFMLTRVEELASAARDQHDRFPTGAAWAVRNAIELRPVVDEIVALLQRCCDVLWPGIARRLGAYAVVPSHDIDHPFLYHGLPVGHRFLRAARKIAGDMTLRRSVPEALRSAAAFLRFGHSGADGDPYFTLRELMDQSERRGLRSTFYLIVKPGLPIDGRAYLHEPAIAEVVREVRARGHHIGLHASYQTLQDPTRAEAEAEALRKFLERIGVANEPFGVRHHYLRWSAREHWAMWNALGARYDATLGYGDRVGFRCGTCHEFPAFDLISRRPLSLRERPLLLMDGAVCPEVGLPRRLRERMLGVVAAVAGRCRAYGGTFELLWHNTFFVTRFQREMYQEVLDVCTTAPANC